MKFSKKLLQAESLLPDLKQLCFRYKELKKLLGQIKSPAPDGGDADEATEPAHDAGSPNGSTELAPDDPERKFFDMLHEDVRRLNDYFCDKEEEVIIWLQQLDEQLGGAASLRDTQLCHIGYIHLHGQLVLLFHWSMLNYAALVKILKKHDKVSSREMKAPVLANALKQPFSTTGMLSKLISKCESKARDLEAVTGGLESLLDACPQYQGLFLVKETEAALDLWTDLRSNASTPSTFVDPQLMAGIPNSLRKRTRSGEPTDVAGAAAGTAPDPGVEAQGPGVSDAAAACELPPRQPVRDNSSRVGTASKSGSGSGSPAAAAAAAALAAGQPQAAAVAHAGARNGKHPSDPRSVMAQ